MTAASPPNERAPRHVVTIFLCVGEEMRPFGRTRDLSSSGAFVDTPERPEVGSAPEIAIVWGDDTLHCHAKIVRHAEDGVGLTFVSPGESFEKAIEDILRTAPLKPPQPRP